MKYKKYISAGISLFLAIGMLAGCGKKDTSAISDTNQRLSDEVYVAEYITPEFSENNSLYDSQLVGNTLYTTCYTYDEENGSKSTLNSYDLESGKFIQTYNFDVDLAKFFDINENIPEHTESDEFYSGLSLAGYRILDDKSLIALLTHYISIGETDFHTTYYRIDYDSDGKVTNAEVLDFNTDDTFYSNLHVKENGDFVYFDNEGNILISSATGDAKKIHVSDNWINSFFEIDGTLFVVYYDMDYSTKISEINMSTGSVGKQYVNLPVNINSVYPGPEGKLYITSSEKLMLYDLTTETYEDILTWVDIDISGNSVSKMIYTKDGATFVFINDYDNNTLDVARLIKKNRNELAEKNELVIASFYPDSTLSGAVIDYNKSQDNNHVSIVTFYDWESGKDYEDAQNEMTAALLAGSGIDLFFIDHGIDVYSLSKQKVFEDLTPYLENSQSIDKDNLFPHMLDLYNYDGKLLSIPYTFTLSTIVANSDIIGTKTEGWTYSDMIALTKAYPDSQLFEYSTQQIAMYTILYNNLFDFIDRKNGICNLDSPEFKEILEYISSLPADIVSYDEQFDISERLSTGKQLLYFASIYDANEIQVNEAMLNNCVTYIGYPSLDANPRSIISPSGSIAILSACSNKDAAWNFYEFYMNRIPGWDSFGISSNKKIFADSIAEDLKNAGKPSGSGFSTGSWEYEYHYVTQDEVDTLYKLLDISICEDTSLVECYNIICEEAEAYFKGQKSLDEVVNIMQSRITIYISENQ